MVGDQDWFQKPPTHPLNLLEVRICDQAKESILLTCSTEKWWKKYISTRRHSLLVLKYAGRRGASRSIKKGRKISSSVAVHQLKAREPQGAFKTRLSWEKGMSMEQRPTLTASTILTPPLTAHTTKAPTNPHPTLPQPCLTSSGWEYPGSLFVSSLLLGRHARFVCFKMKM